MPKHKVAFFYPTRAVGGAQYLFARIATYLASHPDLEISIYDYEDGFIRSHLGDIPHSFTPYDANQMVTVEGDTTLILALSYLGQLGTAIRVTKTTRLLFWDLHPYNLLEQLALSGIYKAMPPHSVQILSRIFEDTRRRKLANFIELALRHNGMAFMSQKNYLYNKMIFGFTAMPHFLPVAVEVPVDNFHLPHGRKKNDASLHIAWLSRLAQGKIRPLLQLLSDVRRYQDANPTQRIITHIIGVGDATQQIVESAGALGVETNLPGRLEGNALSAYITEKVDVGFGMGTAALEFAVRGIPTVLTLGGTHRGSTDSPDAYRWLYDAPGYNLSAEATPSGMGDASFAEIIEYLLCSDNLQQSGLLSYRHAVELHGLPNVASHLIDQLFLCSFTLTELEMVGLFEPTSYEKLLLRFKKMAKTPPITALR